MYQKAPKKGTPEWEVWVANRKQLRKQWEKESDTKGKEIEESFLHSTMSAKKVDRKVHKNLNNQKAK